MKFDVKTVVHLLAILSIIGLCGGCGSKKSGTTDIAVGLAAEDSLTPLDDIVLWIINQAGERETYWVKGNRTQVHVIASREDIAIPVNDALWQWEETKDDEGNLVVGMRDLVAGKYAAIIEPETEAMEEDAGVEENDPEKTRIIECQPLASIGPYVFLRMVELDSGSPGESSREVFSIYDLNLGQETSLIGEEEIAELKKSDSLGRASEDFELTQVMPGYNAAGILNVSYVFSTYSVYKRADETTQTYSRSIAVPARKIPRELGIYSPLSPLVALFMQMTKSNSLGGWIPVGDIINIKPKLWEAFTIKEEIVE
jgi:hypothetical protein